MKIDLTRPSDFTLDNVRMLIASGDDHTATQIRVTKEGIAFLSKAVGGEQIEGLVFRLETFWAGNNCVGPNAANDREWIKRVYQCLKKHWPHPESTYIDIL